MQTVVRLGQVRLATQARQTARVGMPNTVKGTLVTGLVTTRYARAMGQASLIFQNGLAVLPLAVHAMTMAVRAIRAVNPDHLGHQTSQT